MADERNPWRDDLERSMPVRDDVLARNRAITARYARWYLTEPAFKWTAMASFASYETGQVLALAYPGPHADSLVARTGRTAIRALAQTAIELVRRTNLGVFDDVGWAHHAFLARGGDAGAIASQLAESPTHRDLARGFAEIAHGLELARKGESRAARFATWEGNRRILRHEQIVTVQPLFGRIDGAFGAYLTTLGVARFQQLGVAPVRGAWFLPYALNRFARTRRRADLPDLTDFDQRWRWLEREVFPLFRELESRGDPQVRATMTRFAALDGGGLADRTGGERSGAEVAA